MGAPEYRTVPLKTDKMPPGILYIVSNEAAERFSFYGMNSILVVFMTTYLCDAHGNLALMTDARANAWFHTFVSAVYGLCVLGAVLSDAFIGKFRTIMLLSIVYCFGHLALAMDHTRLGLFLGMLLISIGAGGIKPCVSANVGDQFGVGNQHLLARVFSWFYFSINFGSAFSTLLIPWLLEPCHSNLAPGGRPPSTFDRFLEQIHSPSVAFGVPGIFMLIATGIFWLGRKKFVHIQPSRQRFVAEFFHVEMFRAARAKPGENLIRRTISALNAETLKILGNLLIPVPFVAIFWALWQQNFSSWVEQAKRMDCHLFGHEWLPAQIQTANPIFILVMLPLFAYAIYPAIDKVFRLTPLRKIGLGFCLTAFAFLIVGWIQVRIDAAQSPNIIWQVLAFVVLTAAEVMVSPTHLEFAYTQAPRRLKSLVMCTYLLSVSIGNQFTAVVNALKDNGTLKLEGASYFFFFATLMVVAAILFMFVAGFYRGKTYVQGEAEPRPS
jgi:POT family proton-dependent oligopeptide transporter